MEENDTVKIEFHTTDLHEKGHIVLRGLVPLFNEWGVYKLGGVLLYTGVMILTRCEITDEGMERLFDACREVAKTLPPYWTEE